MAANTKNKYPSDKTGTKYSEFKNTKRVAPGKTRTDKSVKQSGNTAETAEKTS